MPNGGISLLPEEMRKKEQEELEREALENKEKPEFYIPEKGGKPAKEPEIKPTPPLSGELEPAPAKGFAPVREEKTEVRIPYKPGPRRADAPPAKPPIPLRKKLQVSLIPPERTERGPSTKLRKIAFVVLLLLEIILIGALFLFIRAQVDSSTREKLALDQSIESLKSEIDSVRLEQQDLWIFEKKLAAMSTLLPGHVHASKILKFLEKSTLPDVWYSSYISSEGGKVVLEVMAKDMETAAEQIAHLQTFEEIAEINVNSFQARPLEDGGAGEVSFDMQIIFRPEFLLSIE
ncbi:hypothetical protein KJ969_00080 [Patescibacteria group bacterium]|nr:hypothetical protein [Patescibacteria group bacterium]MBU1921799.1 hypothetical protein [Patescibacteria group bacterium]